MRKQKSFDESRIIKPSNYKNFKQIMENKSFFVRMFWCELPECEQQIKKETGGIPKVLDQESMLSEQVGKCLRCGKTARHIWLFAHS
jgi:prolyl-tRNA synthetase